MKNPSKYVTAFILLATLLLSNCGGDSDTPKPVAPTEKKVLMFVALDRFYYSEYIVMREALEAAGYPVEVRSSGSGTAKPYMLPEGTTIDATANTLGGSNYSAFQTQFQNMFGESWNASLNSIPATLTHDGKIQEVQNMDNYYGLVIVGGTGSLDYRADGAYSANGAATASDVQAAAEKLNTLAAAALTAGKPVLAQCHGASLPVFWMVPGTATGLLNGKLAAGFPEPATNTTYNSKNVTLRADDKVVVASPADALNDNGQGDFKLLTSRDWYPQTVAHAAKTFLNILNSFPETPRNTSTKVLILHGGAVNESNCGAGNRANDIPCNYGGGDELPADFTHVKTLLQASKADGFNFTVTDLNLTGTLPYTATSQSSIETYLNGFDVVLFFKHWSTGVNATLQNALVAYAENGGGILALHHGLYNDIDDADNTLNKNILAQTLFKTESAEAGWGAERNTYKLVSTNYGHFVSTFQVNLENNPAMEAPGSWPAHPGQAALNSSLSLYPTIEVFDEIYTNKVFINTPAFGVDVNKITPLFSNNLSGAQAHTEGFVRTFNANSDDKIGRIGFFQPGESKQSFGTDTNYGQVVRNAVFWLGNK